MTKTIKMSLAAAMAVAAFSSTASAGSLEEAIKGVSIKGQVNVEYQTSELKDTEDGVVNNEDTENGWEYDVDLTATIPVNDTITAELGWQMDTGSDTNAGPDVREGATVDSAVTMTKANFTAKLPFATVKVGKQGQPTPFFDDNRGNGIVALVPAGPVTLAAGHFTNLNGGQSNNAGVAAVNVLGANHGIGTRTQHGLIHLNIEERDATALAAIGSFGPINAQVWYAQLSSAGSADGATNGGNVVNDTTVGAVATGTTEKGAEALAVMVGGKFGPAQVDLMYAEAQLNGINDSDFDKETLLTVTAGLDVGPVALTLGAGMTNDAQHDFDADDSANDNNYATMNQRLHGTDLSADGDAKTNLAMEVARLDDFNDATAFLIGASTTMDKFTFGAAYLTGEASYQTTKEAVLAGVTNVNVSHETDVEFEELDLSVSYAMSKNFTISGYYAMLEADYKYKDMDNGTQKDGTSVDYDEVAVKLTYKF